MSKTIKFHRAAGVFPSLLKMNGVLMAFPFCYMPN